MKKLTSGDTVELKTSGSIKDYIHVTDVAEAILATLEHRLNGPVNIGTGTGIRILDLARTIAETCGLDATLIKQSDTPTPDPFPVTVANTQRLRSTGWTPKLQLTDGLQQLRQSLR